MTMANYLLLGTAAMVPENVQPLNVFYKCLVRHSVITLDQLSLYLLTLFWVKSSRKKGGVMMKPNMNPRWYSGFRIGVTQSAQSVQLVIYSELNKVTR